MWEQTWADRLLAGEPVDDDGGLVGVVAALRATADAPPPAPSAALAEVLRVGLPPAGQAASPATASPRAQLLASSRLAVRQWRSRTARVAVAGVAASLAMGAGVATAAVSGVTPLDYVPEPVKRGVETAVSAVADALVPGRSDNDNDTGPAVRDDPAPALPPEKSAEAPRVVVPAPVTTPPAPRPASPAPSAVPSPTPSASAEAPPPVTTPPVVPTPTPLPTPSAEPTETPSPMPGTDSPSPEGSEDPGRGKESSGSGSPSPSADPVVPPGSTEGEPGASERPGRPDLTLETGRSHPYPSTRPQR